MLVGMDVGGQRHRRIIVAQLCNSALFPVDQFEVAVQPAFAKHGLAEYPIEDGRFAGPAEAEEDDGSARGLGDVGITIF